MRFRRASWDIVMPDSLVAYWTAWNSDDPQERKACLQVAVTDDVVWNDPRDSFVGIDALEAAMTKLRTSKAGYRFAVVSEIDHHNSRLRYRWDMSRNGRTLMQGVDIATVASHGLIERVDGFFGDPTPVKSADSGVPQHLQ